MIKVSCHTYLGKDEKLLHVSISQELGNKKSERVLPFYVQKSDTTINDALFKAMDELPKLFEMFYQSGLAKEKIEFTKTTTNAD